jgi:uncharacterized membrane protein HdeD (DUF308 family)
MDTLIKFFLVIKENIIDPLIALLFVLAVALFFWGVIKFIMNSSSDKTREDGKWEMVWGIIGIFIMASVNGIMALIKGTFGL